MTLSADDRLQQSTQEFMAVLVHTKKLLRVRNQLCSPFLRLHTEIVVHILSFVMAELDYPPQSSIWKPIYCTCHHIHNIMHDTTALWWNVDCLHHREANFIFTRSEGGPRVLHSDLRSASEQLCFEIEDLLDIWRHKPGFRGHRLRDLDFYGPSSTFFHFSWIFEQPLPRLESLKINLVDSFEDSEVEVLPNPVPLELSVGMSLRVLDLRNVTLSWSSQSRFFGSLQELHLNFEDCERIVTIPEDELFGIFDASPQLKHLSLIKVGHEVPVDRNGTPLPPNRIIRFPNLTSLILDNDPMVVKYTLTYMELPAIDSLHINSIVTSNITQTPTNMFLPDGRLPGRLFSNPPTFTVRTADNMEPEDLI